MFSFDLLINAVVSGVLIGGFYAAVTCGVSLSFGILDIVNIAHPAFIILGSYIAYIANTKLGVDPILVSIVALPAFYALGAGIYQVYYVSFEKRGQESLRGLAFFFGLLFITEVSLQLYFGVDYRYVEASYIGPTLHLGNVGLPLRILVPCIVSLILIACLQLLLTRTFVGRAIMAVAQDQLALRLMGVDPIRIKRIAFGISIATASLAGAFLIIIQPVEPSVGREYIGRIFAICVLGGMGSLPGTLIAAVLVGIVESLTSTFYGPSWAPAVSFGFLLLTLAVRPAGLLGAVTVRSDLFFLICLVVGAVVFAAGIWLGNDYYFFAGYVVVQYIVLSTAWNILGGYCGYVNFGTAAFFALGAYSTVAIHKLHPLPIPVLLIFGGAVSGIVGFGMGYLTLRLRGAFFAIATLALAVVLQTLVVNWDYVGGSRGAYVIRPENIAPIGSYVRYLFLIMMLLAIGALTVARLVERSRLGYGFATIRDDELAAEALGVPTLRLKLIATTISGALMGMAGAPFPYYISFLQPDSTFGLDYAVNSIAMPLIGGTTSWAGPLIGAVLLGSLQQLITVTISSAVNLLIVGVLLVAFVIIAPNGIIGLFHKYLRRKGDDFVGRRKVEIDAPASGPESSPGPAP